MSDITPSSTVLTNELTLHDFKGVKISITYGDANLENGYSYSSINYRANDEMLTMNIDRDIFNFSTTEITLRNKKIWNEFNQGPESGMNSDMLDGLHALDFKDRLGTHHFNHAVAASSKKFVKIATFTPRRVGTPPGYNSEGTYPYSGIFADQVIASLANNDKITNFIEDTPDYLDYTKASIDAFDHTRMMSNGVYNGVFRGTITMLKNKLPTTFDIHIGLFEDPKNKNNDAWTSLKKFFYISLHDNNIPFLEPKTTTYILDEGNKSSRQGFAQTSDEEEYDAIDTVQDINGNIVDMADVKLDITLPNLDKEYYKYIAADGEDDEIPDFMTEGMTKEQKKELIEQRKKMKEYLSSKEVVSLPTTNHAHERETDYSGYYTPHDPTKNDYVAKKFPPKTVPLNSYKKPIDLLRLYYIKSDTAEVDGYTVVTHKWELYLATDEDTEFHIQPYMSESCLLHQYQRPIRENELPFADSDDSTNKHYINPKSIYDERYASDDHRHYDYEKRIDDMDEEIEEIWKSFDYYVLIAQGENNAKKILMTDENGNVVCVKDNLERHQDRRRNGERVLVSDCECCISESNITLDELAQLAGIRSNIQVQIDNLLNVMGSISDDYVKRRGDTMYGDLGMIQNASITFKGALPDGTNYHMKFGADPDPSVGRNSQTEMALWDLRDDVGNGRKIWYYRPGNNDHPSFTRYSICFYSDSIFFGDGLLSGNLGPKFTINPQAPIVRNRPRVGDIWIKNKDDIDD